MAHTFLLIVLLLAALSPLLTFTRLFQLKEWRFDRLREHLRHEGWLRQLFGWIRPSVCAVGILGVIALSFLPLELPLRPRHVVAATVGLLAWFTLFRFVIGKQRRPVWTRKAVAVNALALLLFVSVSYPIATAPASLTFHVLLIILPLLLPLFATLAIVLLLPIDTLLKVRLLARARRRRLLCHRLKVIGITGSVGKTTTKELLVHLLRDRNILATPAHVNTELGVAELILRKLRQDHELFIVEMGAYKRGEIALLCSLVSPQYGVITFLGSQHLALFGSQEELLQAKGELFAALPPEGYAFLNADSPSAEEVKKFSPCPVITVGTGGHANIEAFDIQEHAEGVSFTVRGVPLSLPLQGTHQVTNVLLAVAVAEKLGVSLGECAQRLRDFRGLAQTFEKKVGQQGQVVLDDTHNASPASFRAAVEWARSAKATRKILVTAGLLELGSEEQSTHGEMGALSREVFHEVYFLSKKCAQYFEQGYGRRVHLLERKFFDPESFKVILPSLNSGTLIVCIGRMPSTLVQRFLT
jgi:UDP-N-acetylmuramoyl-tripeptide--D-alanyl-D-alanine ligase